MNKYLDGYGERKRKRMRTEKEWEEQKKWGGNEEQKGRIYGEDSEEEKKGMIKEEGKKIEQNGGI